MDQTILSSHVATSPVISYDISTVYIDKNVSLHRIESSWIVLSN